MGLASTAEHDYSVRTAGSYVLRQMEARLREEKGNTGRGEIGLECVSEREREKESEEELEKNT
eukprot:1361778-Amorphochlora_amoeboformis.AAC.1